MADIQKAQPVAQHQPHNTQQHRLEHVAGLDGGLDAGGVGHLDLAGHLVHLHHGHVAGDEVRHQIVVVVLLGATGPQLRMFVFSVEHRGASAHSATSATSAASVHEGVAAVGSLGCPLSGRRPGNGDGSGQGRTMTPKASQKRSDNVAKLVAEIVVVPAVEPRVGAGGRHAQHMTNGVDDEHRLLIFGLLKGVVQVEHQVVDVEWHPANGEDESDRHQQRVESSQPL